MSDGERRSLFHTMSPASFPFTLYAYPIASIVDEGPLWTIHVTGPGAITIPGLEETGQPVRLVAHFPGGRIERHGGPNATEERQKKIHVAWAKIGRWEPRPWFVCPRCCRFTPHPDDAVNAYCQVCHIFWFDDPANLCCFDPLCEDFGDPSFGEGTCPAEHAVPPARRQQPETS